MTNEQEKKPAKIDATTGKYGRYGVVAYKGKQISVREGERIVVDRIDAEPKSKVEITDVLLIAGEGLQSQVGKPVIAGAKVTAELVRHCRGKKLVAYRKMKRKGYTKKKGHRQEQSELLIKSISI